MLNYMHYCILPSGFSSRFSCTIVPAMRAGSSLLLSTLDSKVIYEQKERILTMFSNDQIVSDSDILATHLSRFPNEIGHFEGAQDDEGRAGS